MEDSAKAQKFSLRDFKHLDNSPHADQLIDAMIAHYKIDSMKTIKQNAINMMALGPGDNVLEVGCGVGFDAETIANLVAPTGKVTAVDNSQRMIEKAKELVKHPNVEFKVEDATQLSFEDNIFSACHAERLLVSQENLEATFAELTRVVKKSGKLCITALDFGTITLFPAPNSLCKKIVEHWQSLVKNPFVGRSLLSLFNKHGFSNIQLKPEIFYIQDYDKLLSIVPFEKMLLDIVSENEITQDEAEQLLSEIKTQNKLNNFYWSINLISIFGRK